MRFDHRKARRRLADVWRVRFVNRKQCRVLQRFGACVLTTGRREGGLPHRKACKWLVEVRIVGFHHRKACGRLEEFGRVRFFSTAKRVEGL